MPQLLIQTCLIALITTLLAPPALYFLLTKRTLLLEYQLFSLNGAVVNYAITLDGLALWADARRVLQGGRLETSLAMAVCFVPVLGTS